MGFCVLGKCFQGVPNILILTFGFMTFHFDFQRVPNILILTFGFMTFHFDFCRQKHILRQNARPFQKLLQFYNFPTF